MGRAKARRLVQDAGLAVRRRTQRGPVTTDSQQRYPVALNRLARGRRHPTTGLRHHADRGSHDAGQDDHHLLATSGMRCRMSRQGECWDHAVAERCVGSLTRARTDLRHEVTRQEARAEVVDYREMFYHSKRLPAYLGYVSPNAYEVAANVA